MSLDLVAIHEALAQQLRENVSRDVTVYPFDVGDTRSYPCIVLRPREPWVEYHLTMGDNAINGVELDVVVMVAAATPDALRALAAWASNASGSTSSIRGAVESSRSLRGTVADLVCLSCAAPERVGGDDAAGVWELAFSVQIKEHRG